MIVRAVLLSCLSVFTQHVIAQEKGKQEYPAWKELEPLFGKAKDSKEVVAIVKKYKLIEATKGPSGSFDPENHSYTLMYRANKISTIILDVLPPPKGYGEADWTEYKQKLPFGIQKADKQAEFTMRFGKSFGKSESIYRNKRFEIWPHFRKKDGALSELYISPLEKTVSIPESKGKK